MKLIAKKGTAFEQTVRVMCEKMTEGIIGARDMVEKAVGVRPKDTYHIFHWGTISKLTPEFVFDVDKETPEEVTLIKEQEKELNRILKIFGI